MTALLEKTVDLTHRRAVELEEAHRKAEIASEAKSRFLATMSHELRTPLNAVLGFSERLRRPDGMADAAQQRQYIEDIHASGSHLLRLINDILDLAKAEAGKLEPRDGLIDVAAALRSAIAGAAADAERAKVAVTLEPVAALPALMADELMLQHMVGNLLSNAIQLTPPGGTVNICLPTIGFETDAAGASLVAGQIINTQWAAWGVRVTTNSPTNHPAMIFDTANPTGGDTDLGTPNADFSGPGIGIGPETGTPGAPGTSS